MQAIFALALISSTLLAGPGASPDEPAGSIVPAPSTSPGADLRRYLQRPVPRSARFLDHGVISVAAAGGTPHIYRLDLRVGLFDHVSVGVTAHWLPGQRAPQVWPVGAIAIWRWRGRSGLGFEVGGHYRPVLFPPVDPELHFIPQTQLALGSAVLSSGLFSAGLDVGAAHTRIPVVDPADGLSFRRRTVFGGGVFARVGNRRVGLTADALAVLSPDPLLVFELAVELRFGAFEERPRGGWREL
jgi:hypothetical protein